MLASEGSLRLIRENPPGSAHWNQTNIQTLTGSTGSVIVIQFDPAVGTTAPAPNSAPLKVTALTTSHNNTDRIFLQVRPISANPLSVGKVYALIQANGDTTPEQFAARTRLFPSIMFSSSYVLSGTGATATKQYGNLFYDAGDTGALYMKIGSDGYYSQSVSGGPSASLPTGAYLQTLLGDLMQSGNIPWYSALDQFLTAQNLQGTADWAMLSPLSQVALNSAFYGNDLAISAHTQDMFYSQGRQKHMQALLQNQNLSSGARQALQGDWHTHQNLKTDSKVAQKGQWKGWTQAFALSGLTADHNYHQDVSGEMTGISFDVSQSHVIGYQFSELEQNYRAVSGDREGSMKSRVAQGNSYTVLGNLQIQTNVVAGQHALTHKREIGVDMEGYARVLEAQSQQGAHELRVEQVTMMDRSINSAINFSAGARYQAQYAAYEGYTEKGAEDLNLTVKPYQTLNNEVQPLLGLSYHQASDTAWIYTRAMAGYRHSLQSQSPITFGFEAYQGEVTLPTSQPVKDAYTFGLEAVLGSLNGLSLMTSSKVAYHMDRTPCEYQGNISMMWAF
jgi:hypothetical protein